MTEPLQTILDRREAVIKILERDAQDAHDKLANAAPPVQVPDSIRVPLDSLHADAEYLLARLLAGTLTREQVVGVIRDRIDAARLEIEALRARCVEPAGAQQPGTTYAGLPTLFREALAWGMTYGPEIPAHQWDEMRESMVKQYTERASHGQAPAQAAPAAVAEPVAYRVLRKRHHDGEWITDGRPWCDGVPTQELVDDIALRSDGWRIEYAFAAPTTQAAPAISTGDAVFAFASMLTALPHVIPFGAAAWATPGVELATAFNAANGFSVSQNFPDGLVFPKITGDLLAVVEKAAAPVAHGDALDEVRRAVAAIAVVGHVDGHAVVRRLSVLDMLDRRIAARAQAKEGA